jgi:hypothetical protein
MMSICFTFFTPLSVAETETMLSEVRARHGDVLKFYWSSEVGETLPRIREDAAECGFDSRSDFLVQWNKQRSELISLIPAIFHEVFGKNILVRDNNYEVVPPP